MLKELRKLAVVWMIATAIISGGCTDLELEGASSSQETSNTTVVTTSQEAEEDSADETTTTKKTTTEKETTTTTTTKETTTTTRKTTTTTTKATTTTAEEIEFSLEEIPDYSGDAWIYINDNVPYFSEDDYTTEAFESYGDLDTLGRCTVCFANVCQELMPTEERGSISSVKPSGWINVSYDNVDGGWLYNRCHLIGFQLTGENANSQNLITGTRYLNINGMLDWENLVADYVKSTDNHVLYRVTPIFDGNNLLASGVEMEGWSVEDSGDGVCFNIYAYNVQPGIKLNYLTGESSSTTSTTTTKKASTTTKKTTTTKETTTTKKTTTAVPETTKTATQAPTTTAKETYILNTNTMKFHYPSCRAVNQMNDSNKQEYTGSRDDVIAKGYSPCGICNP